MELKFNGEVVEVIENGVVIATALGYASGNRMELKYTEAAESIDHSPILNLYYLDCDNRNITLIDASCDRYVFRPGVKVHDLAKSLKARTEDGQIIYSSAGIDILKFQRGRNTRDVYTIKWLMEGELMFMPLLNGELEQLAIQAFPNYKVEVENTIIRLYRKGAFGDLTVDELTVVPVSHGVFDITSNEGYVGQMSEFGETRSRRRQNTVQFDFPTGNALSDGVCEALYKQATGYSLCDKTDSNTYTISDCPVVSIDCFEGVSTAVSFRDPDAAWFGLSVITPSIAVNISGAGYIAVPLHLVQEEDMGVLYGNVIYNGNVVTEGWLTESHILVVRATDANLELFKPITVVGNSVIPLAATLDAFHKAAKTYSMSIVMLEGRQRRPSRDRREY